MTKNIIWKKIFAERHQFESRGSLKLWAAQCNRTSRHKPAVTKILFQVTKIFFLEFSLVLLWKKSIFKSKNVVLSDTPLQVFVFNMTTFQIIYV